MRRRWIDRALVIAAVLLVVGVAVDSLATRGGRSRGQATTKAATTTTVGSGFNFHWVTTLAPVSGSALALELGTCPFDRLSISVRPGPVLVVHDRGQACRLPTLALDAAVRDIHGQFVHRVQALLDGALPTTIAGGQTLVTPLAPGLMRCWSGRPLGLRASADGKVVGGTIRCRVQR